MPPASRPSSNSPELPPGTPSSAGESIPDLDIEGLFAAAEAELKRSNTKQAPPPKTEEQRQEELRRLAAMVGESGYDLELFAQKGRLVFTCPLCHCRMETTARRVGEEITCSGCNADIIAPDPTLGLPSRPLHAEEPHNPALPKAVLPSARGVEDQALGEGRAGGRLRKSASPNAASAVAQGDGHLTPIPARPDQIMGGNALPTQRRDFGRGFFKKEAGTPPSAEPTPVTAPQPSIPVRRSDDDEFRASTAWETPAKKPETTEALIPRGLQRLNEKQKGFLPRQTMEGEIEVIESWGVTEKRPPMSRKLAILGWVTVLLGGVSAALWAMKEVVRDKTPEELSGKPTTTEEDSTINVYRAQEVLTKYFQSETVEERLKYVRAPEIVSHKLHNFYGKTIAPLKLDRLDDTKEAKIDGVDFLMATAFTNDGDAHEVTLEIPEGGDPNTKQLKLDWECLVGYSDMKWDEFLAREPETPKRFRVLLQADSYYNDPFSDQSRYVSFKIQNQTDATKDYGFCYGYVDTLSDSLIKKITNPIRLSHESGGGGRIRCRVDIQFVPLSRNRTNRVQQVRIVGFEPDWLEVRPGATNEEENEK